ncbi:hypothetical protein [Pantoea sp. App145]|uniref:hypothetical protein n=1 Tax=Pantoea sp. App145 TaxID=3071567 RepID=UPI003A813906
MNSQTTLLISPFVPTATPPVMLWQTVLSSQIAFVSQSPLNFTMSPRADYPNNPDSAEEYERWRIDWLRTNLKAVGCKTTALDKLIALQKMPGYQGCSMRTLTRLLKRVGMKVSYDTVKLAQLAHRTKITDTQQTWFDGNWKKACGLSKKERLRSLLSQPGRPPIKPPELWLLLYNAAQPTGMTTVRNMLAAMTVNINQVQIKLVNDTWHSLDHRHTTSMVPHLIRLLLRLENKSSLQPVEVMVALTEGNVEVNSTAMGHAAAAARARFTQADVEWIKIVWPGINKEVPQFMQMVELLNQYQDLDDMTPGKMVRLLWEIDEYVCPAIIGHARNMVMQQRNGVVVVPDDPVPELIDLEPELAMSPPPPVAKPASPVRFQLPGQDELFPVKEQEWKWQLDQELEP